LIKTREVTLKLQNVSRCEVQSIKPYDTEKARDSNRLAIIYNLSYRKVRLHSSDTLSLTVVTYTDKLELIPLLQINCTQHLDHTDGSRCGVKMFLRIVILVFAATCCTAQVIGKSLHTRH